MSKEKPEKGKKIDLTSREGIAKFLASQKPNIKITKDVTAPTKKEEEGQKEIFAEAEKLIDMEKSGNPQEKYNRGFIKEYYEATQKEGEEYKPYIEQVQKETRERLPELEKQIEENKRATHELSLEHRDPEEYQRQKEASRREEEEVEKSITETIPKEKTKEEKEDEEILARIQEKIEKTAEKESERLDEKYGFGEERKKTPHKTYKTGDVVEFELAKEEEIAKNTKEDDTSKKEKINEIADSLMNLILENKKLEEKLSQLISAREKIEKEEKTQETTIKKQEESDFKSLEDFKKSEIFLSLKPADSLQIKVQFGNDYEYKVDEVDEDSALIAFLNKKTGEVKKDWVDLEKKEKPKETFKKEFTENDMHWGFPNYTEGEGELNFNIGKKEVTIKMREVKLEKKERGAIGKIIFGEKFQKKKLKEPYWEVYTYGNEKLEDKYHKCRNKEEALKKVNEIANEALKEIEGEIKEDEKNKPFEYFIAKKITNPFLAEKIKDRFSDLVDLRREYNTGEHWRGYEFLQSAGENEGFFEFNLFGFVMIIKNVKEIRAEDSEGRKIIDSYSDNAIYKIMGPNGEIIADDIKGYQEARKIYEQKTEKYKKEVEEEFNRINTPK
ncbi:hypothetical protein KKA39_03150 [Patescibacteria group bacterium]|nr:hypothetical protein [Patescibacteria group bacterium]MBU1728272.1 hypothetical protein [Patescibacteria group bacterium]